MEIPRLWQPRLVAMGSREKAAAVSPQAPNLKVMKVWERHFQSVNHLP
jgi:hypothetical protein